MRMKEWTQQTQSVGENWASCGQIENEYDIVPLKSYNRSMQSFNQEDHTCSDFADGFTPTQTL